MKVISVWSHSSLILIFLRRAALLTQAQHRGKKKHCGFPFVWLHLEWVVETKWWSWTGLISITSQESDALSVLKNKCSVCEVCETAQMWPGTSEMELLQSCSNIIQLIHFIFNDQPDSKHSGLFWRLRIMWLWPALSVCHGQCLNKCTRVSCNIKTTERWISVQSSRGVRFVISGFNVAEGVGWGYTAAQWSTGPCGCAGQLWGVNLSTLSKKKQWLREDELWCALSS